MRHIKNSTGLLVLLAAVLLVSAGQAATLNVPADYGTIQAAIDAAAIGDTIEIAPGSYVESFNVNKHVDIVGSGSGGDPLIDTIIIGGNPQTIAVTASGASALDPLLFKDFRVEAQDYAFNFTSTLVEHIRLENVNVQGNDPVDDTESNVGLKVSTLASVNDLQIVDCFFDHLAYGWYFAKHGDWGPGGSYVTNVNVTGTSFSDNQAKAIYVEKLSGAVFENCVMANNGLHTTFWNSDWNAGVDINLKGEEVYSGYTFRGCTISNNGLGSKEGVALTVKGRGTGNDGGGGGDYALHPAVVSDVLIEDCIITGSERGLRFGEPGQQNTTPTNVVVEGCVLVNNTQHYSGSDGSAYGDLVNVCTAPIDAEDNYWGDSDPSDQIGLDGAAGAVDADPVLGANPMAQTLTVPTQYATIHAAVAAAVPGDVVFVQNGSYTFTGTLNINKALTLRGESEAGVVIDVNCGASYGINPSAGGITLESFTLNVITPSGQYAGYVIHASGTPNVLDGFNVNHVTIQGSGGVDRRRAGLDIHGYDNVTLSYVTSNDATWGNGIQITGCTDVTVDNCSTTNNAWGSLPLYCSQYLTVPRACDDVVIDGPSCSFNEGIVFIENQFGLTSTNITVTGYEYLLRNDEFRAGAEGFIFIKDTLADVQAHALAGFATFEHATSLQEIATGEFIVDPSLGLGLTIQQAIDDSDVGGTVNVAAGTYEEQLHITTDGLTLQGAGEAEVTVLSPEDLALFYTTSTDNYPIVFIDGCTGVTVADLTVDGAGRGNANYRFQGVGFWNAGGTVEDASVLRVIDTPFSGSQHGVGVYAYNDTGGPYTVNLTRVTVDDFQKGAIALNGDGLTANVIDCVTIGAGPTDVTAQNGIQLYGGVGGTISGCQVSGNIYTGDGWAASGILLIGAGDVNITDTNVDDGDPAVYCQDTNAMASGVTINNSHVDSGNGFYVRIQDGMALARGPGDMIEEQQPAPFGEGGRNTKDSRGTAMVSIANSEFVGQATGYGLAASNYVAADLIDIDLTTTVIRNWGWGIVAYGSGGEVQIDATGNGLFDNSGFFYASGDLTSQQNASGNYWGYTDPADLAAGNINGDIDYTPWLGGGVAGSPGYAGDFSELWVDDDSPQSGADGRLIEALDLVVGSTINVAGGEYVGTGQLVVTGDLHVLGDPADPAVLRPGVSTGSAGDARGWWLVSDPATLEIRDLVLDGDGYDVYQGLRVTGGLAVHDCVFRNLIHPGYGGVAVAAFGSLPLALTGSTFENIGRIGALVWCPATIADCTYTGKGAGDHLDYFLDIGGGGQAVVTGCTVTGNVGVASTDGSTSAALMVTTYYGDGSSLDASGNVLTGNTTGIAVGYDENDTSVLLASNNNLADNDWGIENTGTTLADGRGNWWGDATGPLHPVDNPGGLGSQVSDYVLFDPYRTGTIICTPDPLDLTQIAPNGDVVVSYLGGSGPVYGFSITATWDQTVATAMVSQPDNGPFADTDFWQVLDLANGFTIDAAIGGTNPGIDLGELFKLSFTGVGGEGVETPIDLVVNYVQDYGQPPTTPVPLADAGLVRVDMGLPVVADVLITDTTIASTDWVKNGDTVVVTATVTDGDALAGVTCDFTQFGGTADQAADGAPVADVYTWTFTPVAGTADAAVTATVTAVDALGNTAALGDDIMADNTVPGALVGVVAMPSHKYDADGDAIHYNQIVMNWDDPSGLDANVAGVEFRYVATGEYPLYTSAVPTAPADHTAGVMAFQATGADFNWYQLPDTTPLARDIYVLAGFVYDQAGNYGPAEGADGNWDASTNYYLGDTHPADDTGDGEVGILDITNLGDAYGLPMPDVTHDAVNVGPTDDYTRFGLPTPDAIIGFQDLMVYAMNFGEVVPTLKSMDAVSDPVLTWNRIDERAWGLELVQECAGLKALNVTGDLPSGVTVTVGGGELVGEQDELVFVRNIDRNGLDAGLAIMGFGRSIQGAGTLMVVTTSQPVENLEIEIDARGLNNEELMVDLQAATDVDLPTVHALNQNFPNPFNPSTTIKFALPQAEDVRLVIYGVDGRLIRSLVNEHRDAGHHEVTWFGNDNAGRRVATGTYFYSIQAGDFRQVRKMSLVK